MGRFPHASGRHHHRQQCRSGEWMAQYGSGVVTTGELVGGTDANEFNVYLYQGEAHSLWVAGADTAGAGYVADPRLTLAGDPNDDATKDAAAIVAEDNAEGHNAAINFT